MSRSSISVIGVELGLNDDTVKMVRSSIRKYVWHDRGLAKESVSVARGKVRHYARGWLEDGHGHNGVRYWPADQSHRKYVYPYDKAEIQRGIENIITKQIEYKRSNNTRGRTGRARERSHEEYDDDEEQLDAMDTDETWTPGTSSEFLPDQSGPSAAAGIRTRAPLADSICPGSALQGPSEVNNTERNGMSQRPVDVDNMQDVRAATAASALQKLQELNSGASGPVEITEDGVKETVKETRANPAPAPVLVPQTIPLPVPASVSVPVASSGRTLLMAMAIGALQPGVKQALQMLTQVDASLERAKEDAQGFHRLVDMALVDKMTEFYKTAADFVAVLAPLTNANQE